MGRWERFLGQASCPLYAVIGCSMQGTSAWPLGLEAGEGAWVAENGYGSSGGLSPEHGRGPSGAWAPEAWRAELPSPWAGVAALPEAVWGRRKGPGPQGHGVGKLGLKVRP